MTKIFMGLIAVLFAGQLFALDVPSLSGPINDHAGILSPKVKQVLSSALLNAKRSTGKELAVLTIKSLDGDSLEDYSLRVAEKWGLGSNQKDNGVLLLIALNDRTMRIEVGQGLEGELPDIVAGRIIRSMRPYFKRSEYNAGVVLGVSEIAKRIGMSLKNIPRVRNKRTGGSWFSKILMLLFFISIFSGRGRGFLGGMLLGNVLGGSGRYRSRGGGFSSGGRFGGGGGGFSGGGASGGW